MADDTPRKPRPPAGSALKDMYNRASSEVQKQVQKRMLSRQPKRGGVR